MQSTPAGPLTSADRPEADRINFVDVARAYAIALVLFSHAMIDTGGWAWADDHGYGALNLLVRSGTPLFVFMFGMMLEIAYVRAARRKGVGAVRARLLRRSWQCYLGYALTAVAGVIGGHHTIEEGARALLFLGDTHFSDILRLYAILLLVAPLIIRLRIRFGVRSLVAILAGVWLLDVLLLNRLDSVSLGLLEHWAGSLLGIGPERYGPSVVHGLTFFLAGMIVAEGLEGWQQRGFGRFYRNAGLLLLTCALVLTPLVVSMGLTSLAKSYVIIAQFRSHNHVGYYALGLVLCIGTLLVLSVVVSGGRLRSWTRVPLQFGRASLSSFAGGNILLALIPPGMLRSWCGGSYSLVTSLAFVLVVLALANGGRVWDLLPRRRLLQAPLRNAP